MNPKVYPKEGGGYLLTDPAVLPVCVLTKMNSADGRWRAVVGAAFVGKCYRYAPTTRGMAEFIHQPTGETFWCEVVQVYDERGLFALMPTECLSFPTS